MPATIRDIRYVHKALKREAEDLDIACAALPRDAAALADRAAELARVFGWHARGEEDALFPALEAHRPGVTATYLFDHDEESRVLDELADHLDEGRLEHARRAASALATLVHLHIRKEHKLLFPLAEELLSPAEQDTVVTRMLRTGGPGSDRAHAFVSARLDDEERAAWSALA